MMNSVSKNQIEEIYRFSNKFNNITFLDDNVIVLNDSFYNEIPDEHYQPLFEYLNQYDVIVFAYSEHWHSVRIKDMVSELIDLGKYVIFSNFTFGYEYYLRKFINSERLIYRPIEYSLLAAYQSSSLKNKVIDSNFRKIKLLKYFTYNRGAHKDYVIQLLKDNNQLDSSMNLITYHNFDANGSIPRTLDDLHTHNPMYSKWEHLQFIKNNKIDMKFLSTYQKIINSENFNIQNQTQQRENLMYAHAKSMFNIISEAHSPINSDDTNVFHYTASITSKTIFPILMENVFHITPKNEIFEKALTNLGFKLYFDSDKDFFTNLNTEYYYSKNTQSILKHNKKLLLDIVESLPGNYSEKWLYSILDSISVSYTYN